MNKSYQTKIQTCLKSLANPTIAQGQKTYMRHQFEYLGIKAPVLQANFRIFIQENGLPNKSDLEEIVKTIFHLPEREYQYFAIYLVEKFSKKLEINDIELLEYLITHQSWWDTVDAVSNLVGSFFLQFPELKNKYCQKWLSGDNLWLKRISLIFQLKYKQKTDFNLLSNNILACIESKEFFLQKAIGWALREYAKTNPDAVKKFVAENQLAPLSKREALKNINKTLIKIYK